MAVNSDPLNTAIMVIWMVAVYFLPFMISVARGHHNKAPIFLLTLFLGWTGIGWIAALIWSVSAVTRSNSARVEDKPKLATGDLASYQELEKLAALRERGHLTAEEFEAEKAKLLRR